MQMVSNHTPIPELYVSYDSAQKLKLRPQNLRVGISHRAKSVTLN